MNLPLTPTWSVPRTPSGARWCSRRRCQGISTRLVAVQVAPVSRRPGGAAGPGEGAECAGVRPGDPVLSSHHIDDGRLIAEAIRTELMRAACWWAFPASRSWGRDGARTRRACRCWRRSAGRERPRSKTDDLPVVRPDSAGDLTSAASPVRGLSTGARSCSSILSACRSTPCCRSWPRRDGQAGSTPWCPAGGAQARGGRAPIIGGVASASPVPAATCCSSTTRSSAQAAWAFVPGGTCGSTPWCRSSKPIGKPMVVTAATAAHHRAGGGGSRCSRNCFELASTTRPSSRVPGPVRRRRGERAQEPVRTKTTLSSGTLIRIDQSVGRPPKPEDEGFRVVSREARRSRRGLGGRGRPGRSPWPIGSKVGQTVQFHVGRPDRREDLAMLLRRPRAARSASGLLLFTQRSRPRSSTRRATTRPDDAGLRPPGR